ncbi:hypothetical protein FRB94_009199 [Tulasnella sp. JGI-2019a]|nr:hypothetical protein FRB93_008705 [Tulasnella sp. JGI-2019a]KAG8995365.1 hypothetical protein FRB94_009199 [Tulasnella sp. JGI-2019a]
MSQTRTQPMPIPASTTSSSSSMGDQSQRTQPISPMSSPLRSPADSFPLLSPAVESGWAAGFFHLLSANTGYGSPPTKPTQHEARRHGAMGVLD